MCLFSISILSRENPNGEIETKFTRPTIAEWQLHANGATFQTNKLVAALRIEFTAVVALSLTVFGLDARERNSYFDVLQRLLNSLMTKIAVVAVVINFQCSMFHRKRFRSENKTIIYFN